jgi:hypothetical protein
LFCVSGLIRLVVVIIVPFLALKLFFVSRINPIRYFQS